MITNTSQKKPIVTERLNVKIDKKMNQNFTETEFESLRFFKIEFYIGL